MSKRARFHFQAQNCFKNVIAANSRLFKCAAVDAGGKSIYIASPYYSLLADASLGSGRPEVKPSTPRPLPARLRELAGKSRWMNWEPNLAEDAPLSEVRRSLCVSASAGASAPLTYALTFSFLLAPLHSLRSLHTLHFLHALRSLRSYELFTPLFALRTYLCAQSPRHASERHQHQRRSACSLARKHASARSLSQYARHEGTERRHAHPLHEPLCLNRRKRDRNQLDKFCCRCQ